MIYQYYERMNTCTTKGAKALRPDLLAGMAEALQALAHADRLRILDVLDRKGSLPVHELVRVTALGQAVISGHLARMRRAGLVRADRKSREVWYAIANPHAVTILDCIRRKGTER